MPRSYFKTLLPRLATELPGIQVFYEEKSNLTLDQVEALRKAGVCDIQPGIEALSSALLTRMDKGVTARQNIALMRYARAVGLTLTWNLLYAFPGDHVEDYEETLRSCPCSAISSRRAGCRISASIASARISTGLTSTASASCGPCRATKR